MLIRVIAGVPESYSIGQLRRDNPSTSFPRTPSAALLAEYDVYEVQPTDPPAYDPIMQRLVEADPVEQSPGVWVQAWALEDYTAEEIAAQQRARDVAETTEPERLTSALEVLTRTLVNTAALDVMSDEDLGSITTLFKPWTIDGVYEAQEIRKYNRRLWICEQAHNGQADRVPGTVPALWSPYRDPAGPIPEWQMLTPPDTWDSDDRVYWDNPNEGGALWVYESNIDANTTEPGRDGTLDRWWAPIRPYTAP